MTYPTLEDIRSARERLKNYIIETPSVHWQGIELDKAVGNRTEVFIKLELFQRTGSFKPRGALNVMLHLSKQQLAKGITAVSAGNHAIAAAYAAATLGTHAKVFMFKGANPRRVELSKKYGAEVIIKENAIEAFAAARQLQNDEGRTFIHPFEGPFTSAGTGTAGLEFTEQVPPLDAMILPIGGGGLCSGFAAALKQIWPNVKVYGVEPEGACAMSQSFNAGKAITIESICTIADSLAPPMAEPYSYSVCRRFVDDIVLVSDDQIRAAMQLMFHGLKLAVEPAGAASTAALCGPLRERLSGQRVGLIACGANIGLADFCTITGKL